MNYLNINDKKLVPVVAELNQLLAEYNVYYQKLRSFHWNILGNNFFDLHNKFEELYNDAKLKIDETAERILTLRYHPVSRFGEYLKMAEIQETSAMITDTEMVDKIISDHQIILLQMKRVITKAEMAGDEGTLDMIGAYIGKLEKASWMLDAWNKNTEDQLKTTNMNKAS
nr:DNA starvation/stationary phase protection protein [uncultured Allomuricauda sp.]